MCHSTNRSPRFVAHHPSCHGVGARDAWRLAAMVVLVMVSATLAACDDTAGSAGAQLGEVCAEDGDCVEGLVCDLASKTCVDFVLRELDVLDVAELLDTADTTPDTAPDLDDADTLAVDATCQDGQVRPCGNDQGECQKGEETCVAGIWEDCSDVGPTPELCDGLDNDCDAQVDEAIQQPCGIDQGLCTFGVQSCSNADWGTCKGAVEPVEEVCDGQDNDCDGKTDEPDASDAKLWFVDADQDTFGDPATGTRACTAPPGTVLDNTDCDDTSRFVSPAAAEVCDGKDNNCNAQIDAADPTFTGGLADWYADTDGDGYGDPADTVATCTPPAGYVLDNTDCDDTKGGVHPGASEVCDGLDNDCSATTADGIAEAWFGATCDGVDADKCREGGLGCVTGAQTCGDTTGDSDEVCGDGIDNDCDGQTDEGCSTCNASIDADFDGSNECDDCDETNGGIYPGANERCNGVDDDCDGQVDEDFDKDLDGYSLCASDPKLFDCNDSVGTINPGAPEACGPTGMGNGVDENCNGYIDEGCGNCNPIDTDGDGVSQCAGDCNPSLGTVYPGAPELCDGVDNDCNTLTVENCGVSEPCNWSGDADVCEPDLLCACVVNAAGSCQGDYLCTAYCNTSATGARGDGCEADQTCMYDLLRSANIHGCGAIIDPLGTKAGGEVCGAATECRSNVCEKVCVGPGCNTKYCLDYCGSDAYCTASNTVCRLGRSATNMDGTCWPSAGPFVGTSSVGQSCTSDTGCDHGLCASGKCTEPCCTDTDCGAGYTCSLAGDGIDTNYVYPSPTGPTCTSDANCPTGMMCFTAEGTCAWRLTETAPTCRPDVSGQGIRRAGAACSQNADCSSNFCERNLSVCVEVCCSDASCPTGLECESQVVQTTSNRASDARVCVNLSTDAPLVRK